MSVGEREIVQKTIEACEKSIADIDENIQMIEELLSGPALLSGLFVWGQVLAKRLSDKVGLENDLRGARQLLALLDEVEAARKVPET